MKKQFAFLLVLLLQASLSVFAQENDIILTPGVGIGPIRLGMSPAEARQHLGDLRIQSFEGAMADFHHYNRNIAIDSMAQFIIGFDSCYTVLDENKDKFPVFKLYFTKNRLSFIGVTSFAEAEQISEKVLLLEKIRFRMTKEESEKILGNEYMVMPYQEYKNCLYNKLGLEIMYDEGLLRYIGIFSPVSDWKGLIKRRSAALKKQWNALGEKETEE